MRLIQDSKHLSEFCEMLQGSEWLAVDTEFMRESTYYPRFCLLQISNGAFSACIDPIALTNLDELKPLFYNPHVVKIFHSGRQDLELLYQYWGRIPAPIFDTQIAASFLGLGDQIGYATFVSKVLDVQLDKLHTRTDWYRRPLSDEQLHYAIDDVHFLSLAYSETTERLRGMSRLSWAYEDSSALTNKSLYDIDPLNAWKRVSSSYHLDQRQLTNLICIAAWRELNCMSINIPRNWLLRDDQLIKLAMTDKGTRLDDELHRTLGTDKTKRYKLDLEPIQQSIVDNHPIIQMAALAVRPQELSPIAKATVSKLMQRTQEIAKKLNISPSTLANKKDVTQLIVEPNKSRAVIGWRKDVIGDELVALARQELTFVPDQ